MAELKTKANDASVGDFIDRVEGAVKRQDSIELLDMFGAITGEIPKMWGSSIIGFGQYHYKSEKSRQEGDWPLTGFSPRKQSLSLYLTTAGYDKYTPLLGKLGKYKIGKGCLYINTLSDVDRSVLGQLIRETYIDSKQLLA
jgi:Domain of unknown function (DU1801)